ncbi:MAG: glycerol-3-phosphate 1-O-acyltransferase PlsY [Gemmatimonadales bacterium]|nr:glycerol-3-phosphate 1-O-acyltransferase PlsY [Gemmatimonadales bacterium]MDZ4388204.1 glycerol-3-phosphate 1-O-acyltransferase PlsY [Gemmatimonadales bacterium]
MSVVLAVVASYLVGAIPTSYLVVRAVRGIDLRTVGSGNLGTTNLFRQLGWRWALPVGVFDTLKGAIPVAVFAPWSGLGVVSAALLGLVAVLGHVYSVFVGFKGGKGVATGGGIVLGMAPLAFLGALATWAVVVRLSGYVSVASITAAAILPVLLWLLHPEARPAIWLVAGLSLLVIWLHRANIARLRAGTEHRFRRGAASASQSEGAKG